MNAAEWTALVVAAIGALGAVASNIVSMILSYKRDKDTQSKVEENTFITKTHAKAATAAAVVAAKNSEEVKSKLNGGVDAAIETALKPVRQAQEDHALQDEQNMREIRELLEDLKRKVLAR